MDSDLWVLGLLALGVSVVTLWLASKTHRSLPLPPGPKISWFGAGVPSTKYPWKTYAEWKKTYGDLIFLDIFGNSILILNSSTATSDLLEKRSGNYSSRPARAMVTLMGFDFLVSAMPYGKNWKRHKNMFLRHFPHNGSSTHHALKIEHVHKLLRNLLAHPSDFRSHLRTTAASIILNIVYGIDAEEQIDEEGDNFVTLADKALELLGKSGIFGAYVVDYIPLLRHLPPWLPGATFKRNALIWRKTVRGMIDKPFYKVKENLKQGTATACMVTEELDRPDKHLLHVDEEVIMNTAATTYAAGSDTTVGGIASLFLAMALHPEIQTKAQKQLDDLLQWKRLPLFSDRGQLPYIDCICQELLRWNPVTPLGLTHYVSHDDEYNGYRIPRGTTIVPNVWGILHDPDVYPDPLTFKPERFENVEQNAALGINPIPDAAFGFGRRMCPGRWFAHDLLWIAVASILSVFHISKDVDEDGNILEPKAEFTSSLLSHPLPFPCKITPRNAAAEKLICQTAIEH